MVDLLAGHTSMTVRQATDGMPIEPDHLYVIPPGTYLAVGNGALHRFAPVNRVPSTTVLWPGLPHQDHQPNIASLLKAHAGYDVVWKGKWHLSYASNAAPGNGGEDWGPVDIKVMEENWGWSGWNPPDAGTAIQQAQGTAFGVFNGNNTAGGGNPNNDGRYVSGDINAAPGQIPGVGGESVVDFLKGRAKGSSKPFCLFVSLVNPHDIGAYPGNLITPPAWQQVGYRREDFAHLGIKLPPNYADDLSTKPRIQKVARDDFNEFASLDGPEAHEEYVNFYAYLHTVVDKHITTVLDTRWCMDTGRLSVIPADRWHIERAKAGLAILMSGR